MDDGRRPDWKRRARLFAAASLLVLSVWSLFGTTGGFGFLNLDDHDYTYRCAFVKDGLAPANVCEAFANARHGGIWMPATYISYMAGITMFGPGAGAHHLVNVAIHSLNAVLLLCLAVGILRACRCGDDEHPRLAELCVFLAVAFWALHPQRPEAVAWIASRKELLCGLFTLGGLLCWLRARACEGRVRRWIAFAGTYACFALACMSKPTAMCFPFLVLALEGLLRRREKDIRRPSFIVNLAAFLVIAAATGALAVYSQTHPEGHEVRGLFSASLPWRLLNAVVASGLYIFQMVAPVGIHMDYRAVPGDWPLHGTLGIVVFAAVVCGIVFLLKRMRGSRVQILSLCLWFTAALAPTLGIFGSFGDQSRADRFLYIPAMVAPLAAAVFVRFADGRRLKAVAAVAALCVAAAFVLCRPVVAGYRNDLTAFSSIVDCDPEHGRALARLGEAWCAEGNLGRGIELLRRSREAQSDDATDAKLAYALMRRGRTEDWAEVREVCAAIAKEPARDARGQGLEALGTAELVARNWSEAARCLVLSVRAPGRHYSSADAILKLAFARHNAGERDDARKLFEWVVSSSGRQDLAMRAQQVLDVLETSPQGILFW